MSIGGDIDLVIDVDLDCEAFRKKKVQFKAALMTMKFDQIEVDVVLYYPKDQLLAAEIAKKAVRLF